jgi:hypothetical protein
MNFMIRFVKELYLTAFTLLYRFPGGSADIKNGQAVAFIALIEWLILFNIELWIEMLTGTRFLISSSRLAITIYFLALCFANRRVLIARGYGIKFEREEFNNLNKSRKFFLVAGCMVLLLATILFSIYTVPAHRHFIQTLKMQGQ